MPGLCHVDRQRAVRGLIREYLELALILFDLALNGVDLILHGEYAADRRCFLQDLQVLREARVERGNSRLQIDVLTRDVVR